MDVRQSIKPYQCWAPLGQEHACLAPPPWWLLDVSTNYISNIHNSFASTVTTINWYDDGKQKIVAIGEAAGFTNQHRPIAGLPPRSFDPRGVAVCDMICMNNVQASMTLIKVTNIHMKLHTFTRGHACKCWFFCSPQALFKWFPWGVEGAASRWHGLFFQ